MRRVVLQRWVFAVLAATGGVLTAQAQTDVALSAYGPLHGPTNGNGTIQGLANSAAGVIELRHVCDTLAGAAAMDY